MINNTRNLLVAALVSCVTPVCLASATPDELAALGSTLTPMGAEKAGNADGTIPAWTGGIETPPASYVPGTHVTDPFPGDKILFTIDASNADQYSENLSPGQLALLKAYPDTWKMNVYKTRRSHSNPDFIYTATKENAKSAELISGGNGFSGAVTGVPFPVPHSALEVVWNHVTRYRGENFVRYLAEAAVEKDGSYNLIRSRDTFMMRYSKQGITEDALENVMFKYKQWTLSPGRLAGDVVLVHDTIDQEAQPRKAWAYDPGQRRVRRAPTVAFDGPGPGRGSAGFRVTDNYDMFNGSPERYNWKLLGKKELYIPYNSYRLHSDPDLTVDDVIQVGHLNPDPLRYELHRVWVVEATLKDDARHIYAKRVLYFDEDSWHAVVADHYDGHGELWRVAEGHVINYYNEKLTWLTAEVLHDLISGKYIATGNFVKEDPVHMFNDELDLQDNDFTPAALRREGR